METKIVVVAGQTHTLQRAEIHHGNMRYQVWVSNMADLARMQARQDLLASAVTLTKEDRRRLNGF